MRKTFDSNFKAKVALEAIRGEKTIAQIASDYELHPNQISQWKKQLLEGAGDLFERPNKKSKDQKNSEEKEGELLKHIGQLKVENDFLKKKYKQLYGHDPD